MEVRVGVVMQGLKENHRTTQMYETNETPCRSKSQRKGSEVSLLSEAAITAEGGNKPSSELT